MIFEEMKQALIAAAEHAGITQYEIYYQREESVSAETLKDEISSFASSVSGGICFRCIVDGKIGYASGEWMTVDAMEELVTNALSNAKCIDSEDEAVIFKGSSAYAKPSVREAKLADAAAVRKTALALQRQTYAESSLVAEGTQSGMLSTVEEIKLYNSNGLSLSNRVGLTCGYASAVIKSEDEAQEDFAFGLGTDFDELKEVPGKAVRGATDKLGAGLVNSGKYDVIFDGTQFRQFLAAFAPVFSAKNARQGLSLLAGKEGTPVASACVSLIDDPMREDSPMQTPFDGEGVATARRNVIENGVLKTLLYDLTTAKKAGVPSTGNGQKSSYSAPVAISPYNFSLAAGDADDEALFAAVGNGIYITECKGFHAGANAVTGDFSIESAGFLIRDGKRAEPIKSFTVAGNFFDLLKQIERIGNEIKWGMPTSFTVFGSPNVLVRGISVAGK